MNTTDSMQMSLANCAMKAADMSYEIETLRRQLAEKDAEIESLRQQLVSVTEERDQWKNDAIDGGNAAYLRQELAAANAEIERLNASPTIEACRQMIRDKAVIEASELHNQLVKKDAEIEWLKEEVRVTKEEDFPRKAEAVANNWRIKLAASQLREQQLREALDAVQQVANRSEGIAGWHMNGDIASWDSILPEVEQALATPNDNTALREMIAKAGEMMRERCVVVLQGITDEYDDEEVSATWIETGIRALPGVTLENLQG